MDEKKPHPSKPICTCVEDAYAELPPELRPKPVQRNSGLRKITCLGCGLVYWTNRKTALCVDCEKKGIEIANSGG